MKMLCFSVLFVFTAFAVPTQGAFTQAATPNQSSRREVAVTFDDLPSYGDLGQMRGVTTRLLKLVTLNKVPAVGFVNEGKLHVRGEEDARTAPLQMWLDAGLELGNHTFSHINIDRVPLAVYEEDVIRGEPVTRKLLREKSMTLRYFRHPMLHTGPTLEYKKALDAFLAARRYTVAPVQVRYAWPAELDLMARLSGMRLRERWSNWRAGPFTDESTNHISIYDLP